jgi:hypothetical protein
MSTNISPPIYGTSGDFYLSVHLTEMFMIGSSLHLTYLAKSTPLAKHHGFQEFSPKPYKLITVGSQEK